MIDVTGLRSEARPIVQQVAEIYVRHTASWFVGLVAHGSAVKGSIIPGCSDIDLQLYLEPAAFSPDGQLPLALGFAIRRELEGIPLVPFRYVQCYALGGEPPPNWVGPVPGAYHLVSGRLPVREATAHDLRAAAGVALAELDVSSGFIMGKLLDPGGERLKRSLRLLCTKVWPVLYQVLTLQEAKDDPGAIWCLPKDQAIERLCTSADLRDLIERFYRAVRAYYPEEDSLDRALVMIEAGMAFLEASKSWYITSHQF
ncbi:MAG: hypothetical protein PVH11_06205 [Anaerolineae bacterium]|jgi:hypothetical protein